MIRTRSDPTRAAAVTTLSSLAAAAGEGRGRVGTDGHRAGRGVTSESTARSTAPIGSRRGRCCPVGADWLGSGAVDARRRPAPSPWSWNRCRPSRAARLADREVMSREADAEMKERQGFRVSARDRKRLADVRRRETRADRRPPRVPLRRPRRRHRRRPRRARRRLRGDRAGRRPGADRPAAPRRPPRPRLGRQPPPRPKRRLTEEPHVKPTRSGTDRAAESAPVRESARATSLDRAGEADPAGPAGRLAPLDHGAPRGRCTRSTPTPASVTAAPTWGSTSPAG